MTDEELIGLFFERSEQAIANLDEKYGKLCRSVSFGVLKDRQDSEECVNDAYLGVWNSVPPARPDPLAAYVCRIVRNLSLKRYYAKNAVKRGSAYEVAMEELEGCLPAAETVESELDGRELTRIIEEFLGTLSDLNRTVFIYRYWFSASYDVIARKAGISEKNVSVRLTRIRRQLKEFLTEREVFL